MGTTTWQDEVIPGYTRVVRDRVLRYLGEGPHSVEWLMRMAGIDRAYAAQFFAGMVAENLVVFNHTGDVLSLPPKDGQGVRHPLDGVLESIFRFAEAKETFVVTCRICGAGWFIDKHKPKDAFAATHFASVLKHVAIHYQDPVGQVMSERFTPVFGRVRR